MFYLYMSRMRPKMEYSPVLISSHDRVQKRIRIRRSHALRRLWVYHSSDLAQTTLCGKTGWLHIQRIEDLTSSFPSDLELPPNTMNRCAFGGAPCLEWLFGTHLKRRTRTYEPSLRMQVKRVMPLVDNEILLRRRIDVTVNIYNITLRFYIRFTLFLVVSVALSPSWGELIKIS